MSSARETRNSEFRSHTSTFWRDVLWGLLAPRRFRRVRATAAGWGLLAFIAVTGTGAYLLASHVLFLTCAVLATVLILSGVMSWMNLRSIECRLSAEPSMRAGAEYLARVEILNSRGVLPAMALRVGVRSRSGGGETLWPDGRIDARSSAALAWRVKPLRRGVERLEVTGVLSLFPFGFFEKTISLREGAVCRDAVVRPAAVEYRRLGGWCFGRRGNGKEGRTASQAGRGGDLLMLRDYRSGDAQNRINWKASARMRRLLVREFADEWFDGVVLRVGTGAWESAVQFEKMCSLAATLAEDLFVSGDLLALSIDGRWRRSARTRADVDAFWDELAMCQQTDGTTVSGILENVLTFSPGGGMEVIAYVGGKAAASA